jgi:hypothetical protein
MTTIIGCVRDPGNREGTMIGRVRFDPLPRGHGMSACPTGHFHSGKIHRF